MQTAAFLHENTHSSFDLICEGNRADVMELLAGVRREGGFGPIRLQLMNLLRAPRLEFLNCLFSELLAGGMKELGFFLLLITGFLRPSSCRKRLPYWNPSDSQRRPASK